MAREYYKYEMIVSKQAGEELFPLLNHLFECGRIGHSVCFEIDGKKFYFDGDGSSQILAMNLGENVRCLGKGEWYAKENWGYVTEEIDKTLPPVVKANMEMKEKRIVTESTPCHNCGGLPVLHECYNEHPCKYVYRCSNTLVEGGKCLHVQEYMGNTEEECAKNWEKNMPNNVSFKPKSEV